MKLAKLSGSNNKDVWVIYNGFSSQHLELSNEEATELYNLLGEALTVVTKVEIPTMTPRAIEWAKCGDWDGLLRAIKEVRAGSDCSLKQAKGLVEQYMEDNNIPTPSYTRKNSKRI